MAIRTSGAAGACCASIATGAPHAATSRAAIAAVEHRRNIIFASSRRGIRSQQPNAFRQRELGGRVGIVARAERTGCEPVGDGKHQQAQAWNLWLQPQFGKKRDARSRTLERLVGRQRAARADGRRLRLGVLSAPRPLARLGRCHALSGVELRNADVGRRVARADEAHHDFRNGPHADLPSGRCR